MARRRGLRRLIVALLTLALVAGGIYAAVFFLQRSETLVSERCTATAGGRTAELATDQSFHAALISAAAVQRGLPPRAASIALATAMQESKLRNIGHGDQAGPDSRGLFQQRPSQGWGTEAQVMDPYYATNAFYDALVKLPGYETMAITDAAQAVQRSAFPLAYAQHEDMARAFASALTGQTPGALQCTLRSADAAGDPAELTVELERDYGSLGASTEGQAVVVPVSDELAWSVAQWAVASANDLGVVRVDVAGRSWIRGDQAGWQDAAAPSPDVRITLASARS
ncbi:hypothetical protein PSET11_01874 [Arthrobacter ulcerisalmonis]|uniref:Uncharacterized protein n=1 Tax=Arthrobacter ulcerisalmonis TaxID=2483813 RepID=A0A3P5X9I5_9MICC|nr:hypothetical protein [Arthrobacter ulcerisalmonis]VDC26970.1 hypothetical protein PSET11_01874 [Arthrobacter ulcerisalmonis]